MGTQLTQSQLVPLPTASSSTDTRDAWHIFGILLSIGRPASPIELASSCGFCHMMPESIQFLCQTPNSPLQITSHNIVTVSSAGCFAIARFMSNANADVDLNFPRRLGFDSEELRPRRLCGAGDALRTYKRRKRLSDDKCDEVVKRRNFFKQSEETRTVLRVPSGEESFAQAHLVDNSMSKCFSNMLRNPSDVALSIQASDGPNPKDSLLVNSNVQPLKSNHGNEDNTELFGNRVDICSQYDLHSEGTVTFAKPMNVDGHLNFTSLLEAVSQGFENKYAAVSTEAKVDENPSSKINLKTIYQKHTCNPLAETNIYACETIHEDNVVEERGDEPMIDDDRLLQQFDNVSVDATQSDRLHQEHADDMIMAKLGSTLLSPNNENSKTPLKNQMLLAGTMLSGCQTHFGKSSAKSIVDPREALTCKPRTICKSPEKIGFIKPSIGQQLFERENKSNLIKQYVGDDSKNHKEENDKHNIKKEKLVPVSGNNQLEQKEFPNFDFYIVEQEEGSGGYGTVYRSQRKKDGLTFAIKCPHVNANRYHIQNEVKMLERFGGKNFVIKYEGSLKSGNSDCLVLEHIEHDRPEVLKREINVTQLRWYGFCMFKALAALHKQGIVHRDVKPGNFLFSRKANKGYLIDFNLALDLHQRYGITEKIKSRNGSTFNHVTLSTIKAFPPTHNKSPSTKALGLMNHEAGNLPNILPKNLRRKADLAKDYANLCSQNSTKSQGADGSGITSAKDVTSNRTASAERLREPIPCQGRKELLSLVQEALHVTNCEAVSVPASKRKRVAAFPGNGDRKFIYLTPMPLHSTGIPAAGSGVLKTRGDGKQKREGPCVGTKGFRAPEVLVRSLHQGQKVDIWSAGVTLLYLILGRTPFAGDPDQNIKEIAKLRGIEDLWEVAKLHNRESSFPADLLDIKYLPPVRLREWCRLNTRRPDLLEMIPASLFDLMDRCLTVNPRLRISAEEALEHEFIAPCNDIIRKHRLSRQGLSQDSGVNPCSEQVLNDIVQD